MSEPKEDALAGIRCPVCACAHSHVTNTERLRGGRIRRRRVCRHCGKRFMTLEIPPSDAKR